MLYTILNIILLVGGVQGILFAVFALTLKRFRGKSTFFLALLILSLSINNLQYLLWEVDILDEKSFYGYYYLPLEAIMGVFYYFYIKFFLYPKSKISLIEKTLYLPFLLFFSYIFIYKILYLTGGKDAVSFSLLYENYSFYQGFSILYSIFLISYGFYLIKNFEKKQRKNKNQISRIKMNWLKISIYIFLIISVFWIYGFLSELKFGVEDTERYYFLWVLISVTIYVLGHVGLYHFGIRKEREKIHKFVVQNPQELKIEDSKSDNPHIAAFENLIEKEKLFLDSNITLEDVADKLNLSKGHLSRIINLELEMKFSDYINRMRIEEAKKLLNNPEFENYTLVAIGLEAGFNSKSTFYSTFKKQMNCTPYEYRKRELNPD